MSSRRHSKTASPRSIAGQTWPWMTRTTSALWFFSFWLLNSDCWLLKPSPYAADPRVPMIWIMGINIAMTIVPTITASTIIMSGSITEVRPATALSTSSS